MADRDKIIQIVHESLGGCPFIPIDKREYWATLITDRLITKGVIKNVEVKVGVMLWPICWDGVLGAWVVDDKPERVNEVGTKGFFVSATYEDPEAIDEFHPYEEIGDVYFWSREEAVNAATAKERPEEVQK